MTFKQRYDSSGLWYDKVLIMSIYHTIACHTQLHWKISDTAAAFEVSIGLVSENLRLADAIDANPKLFRTETRVEALKKLGKI